METYFWSASVYGMNIKSVVKLSGLVTANSPVAAYNQAIKDAGESLKENGVLINNQPALTAFNKV